MSEEKSEFQSGVDHFKEQKAQKDTGYDDTHPDADSFREGYRRGQETRNPNNTSGAGETADKVHEDYEKLTPEQREAYKAGYREGSAE